MAITKLSIYDQIKGIAAGGTAAANDMFIVSDTAGTIIKIAATSLATVSTAVIRDVSGTISAVAMYANNTSGNIGFATDTTQGASCVSNVTHQGAPYIQQLAYIWNGSSAIHKQMAYNVKGVSGQNSQYYWTLGSSDHADIITARGDTGNVGIGKSPTTLLDVNGTVTATAFAGPLTGNVTGNCSGSSGSCTGNAASATSATSATNATNAANLNTTETNITLANGTNNNVAVTSGLVYIGGPTGGYTITGFSMSGGNVGGALLTVWNNTAQALTFAFNDSGSSVGNRIAFYTSGNIVLPAHSFTSATFVYSAGLASWLLLARST